LTWGTENNVRWLEGLRTGATLKVSLVGDSNTSGFVGGALQGYLDSLPTTSVVNHAVSGSNIEEWRTGTGPFAGTGKALSDVITYDPDLVVLCFGTNDPLSGRTAANFATSLNSALTTLRASLDVHTTSILLLTPNAMGSVNDQDEFWSLQIRSIIRAAAEKFNCSFFDKNGLFPNSNIDLSAGAMQNKWWDSARVHTATLSTNVIAVMIAEFLVPREIYAKVWDNIPTKAAADLSTTYPPGVSLTRMADGAHNGFTATLNPISTGGHFAIQIHWSFLTFECSIRISIGGAWSAWVSILPSPLGTVGSLAANHTITAGAAGLSTQRTGNEVTLSGRLTISPAAQVISSTTFCNITTTTHRPLFNIQTEDVGVLNAGGTLERLRIDVTTAGNIVVRASSVMTDANSLTFNVRYKAA